MDHDRDDPGVHLLSHVEPEDNPDLVLTFLLFEPPPPWASHMLAGMEPVYRGGSEKKIKSF